MATKAQPSTKYGNIEKFDSTFFFRKSIFLRKNKTFIHFITSEKQAALVIRGGYVPRIALEYQNRE
jgi:hypothetical protein